MAHLLLHASPSFPQFIFFPLLGWGGRGDRCQKQEVKAPINEYYMEKNIL